MRSAPEWFPINEEATPQVMKRIAASVTDLPLAIQVRSAPLLAHWFLCDSLLLANRANREGMHANALASTRQCMEAVSIIELGLCGHPEAEAMLIKWDGDELSPGNLRAWLAQNVWPHYGNGLWSEPWAIFMQQFFGALQPYAHYGRDLAQWQLRLHFFEDHSGDPDVAGHGVIEMRPQAYDAQKATRITLFHAIITFALGRTWMAANLDDAPFANMMAQLGAAIGKSKYLDGYQTNWGQQFWAMLWARDGGTILE